METIGSRHFRLFRHFAMMRMTGRALRGRKTDGATMSIRILGLAAAALLAANLAGCASRPNTILAANPAASEYGIVAVKSAHPFADTVARLKADVAAKGLVFFDQVAQQKLAADA